MKRRLSGVTQRMAALASAERHPDQTLDGGTYRAHSIEFLVDHVGGHIVALKKVAVETAKIAIDPLSFLYFFDAIHGSSLAFIKEASTDLPL